MFEIRMSWKGPNDKILINGKFFRMYFINVERLAEFTSKLPGLVSNGYPIIGDGIVTRSMFTTTYDEAVGVIQSLKTLNPAEIFNDRDALKLYEKENGITYSVEILPV